MKFTEYDKNAIMQIHLWKNPKIGFVESCLNAAQEQLSSAKDRVMNVPYVADVTNKATEIVKLPQNVVDAIDKASSGLFNILTDASAYSVRTEAILADFKKGGHPIEDLSDIQKLPLEDIDRVVGFLDAKYKGIALCEGGVAGAAGTINPVAGALAIAADIPTITSLCMRAIGEYATHYGFDISNQEERLFMMNILYYSSNPTDVTKQIALANLTRIANDVAKKKLWKDLNNSIFVNIVQGLAKSLGIRLTKAKLAQIIPVAGIVLGAGYNTYLMSTVCETAYMMYRERYLAEFYNDPKIIEQTVEPAKEISFVVDENEVKQL